MTVSYLRRLPILILVLTLIALTSEFHLQGAPANIHDSQPNIIQDDQLLMSKEGKASLLEDETTAGSKIMMPQNITLFEEKFNSGYLVIDKYVLLIKTGPYKTTLWKLDLETIKLEQIPFPFQSQLNSVSLIFTTGPKFMDFGNGDIALGFYQTLFILNKETLEIKQTLVGRDKDDSVRQFYFYEDVKTGQKIILVGRQRGNSLVSQLVRLPSGQYEAKAKTILSWQSFDSSPKNPNSVYLTGLNSGVYLEYCSIKPIGTLDSIVSISYDPKDYYYQRTKVAVSYDESFFVLMNKSGFFEFYNIGNDLKVSLKQSIYASKDFSSVKKGAITTDDAYVFAAMIGEKNKPDIAKVDPSTGQCTFIAGTSAATESLLDFNLFDAKYNRLITLQKRESNKYFLQLRAVSNLSTIFEYPLVFDFPILEAKLVGSPEWDLTFAVALKIRPTEMFVQNDTLLVLFETQTDIIFSRNKSRNVSYDVIEACYKYVVSYKRSWKVIRIYKNYDLSSADQILVNELWQGSFTFEKNILMIRDYHMSHTSIYDFRKSFQKLGQLYASNNIELFGFYSVILLKRGLLYQAPTINETEQSQPAAKIFFNISNLPFQKETLIQTPTLTQGCEYAEYYLSPKENCNFIFFINCLEEVDGYYCKNPRYVKYKECSKEREEYPIEGYPQKISSHMQYISSDRKYIIAILKPFDAAQILIDIRPIDDLNTVFFHKFIGFSTKAYTFLNDVFVDLIKDNLILLRSLDFITAYYIQPIQTTK